MSYKCADCGSTERFRARQRCHGHVPVIVNKDGNWLENDTDDGSLAGCESEFCFDDPGEPDQCVECGSENIVEASPRP